MLPEARKTFCPRANVLFVTDEDINGFGTTTHIEITRALRNIGWSVEPVFLWKNREPISRDVSPMHLLHFKDGSYLTSMRAYARLMLILLRTYRRFDYVIVEPNSGLALVPFAVLGKIMPAMPKFVLDVRTQPVEVPDNWRGTLSERKFALTVKLAARCFDGILAITEGMAKYLNKITDISRPVGIWTSGVNEELFDPRKAYEPVKAFKDRFVVMYHGVFSPTRGLDRIIRGVDAVRSEHPEILLCLLGDGSMRSNLVKMVEEMNLQDHVLIHDPVPQTEIPRYLSAAQAGILAFPDHEWWSVQSPLKLFEYLAMATPVIATDIAMNRNVIGATRSAFFIRDNSPEEIAAGMRLAILNREALASMGAEGRVLIENDYTWGAQAAKIVENLTTLR